MATAKMRQRDASKWKPRALTAPDGTTFTPSSLSEENELLTAGYKLAPTKASPSTSASSPATGGKKAGDAK